MPDNGNIFKYQEALNYLRYSASESEYMKGVEEQNNIYCHSNERFL